MASKRKEVTKETSAPQQFRAKKSKKDPIADKFKEITDAFEMLPLADEVKKMLAEVLPCSLGEFSEHRDKFQEQVVEAVAGVLGEVEAALNAAVSGARSQCDEVAAKKPQLESEATGTTAKFEAAKAETLRLKVALADMAVAFRAATDLLTEAERAKKVDAQASQEAGKKKGQLETALANLQALSTTWPVDADAQKKRDDLIAFLSKQKFEESILIALPVALSKAPETRGQFDLIAITQLENDIGKRIAGEESILTAAQPGQEKCEAIVQQALQRLDGARVKQRGAAKDFDAASQQQTTCEELSVKALSALRDLGASSKRLGEATYAAEAEVELFEQGPMETFKALRTRVTPAPVVEEEVEEPALEEPEAVEVEMPEAEVAAVAVC